MSRDVGRPALGVWIADHACGVGRRLQCPLRLGVGRVGIASRAAADVRRVLRVSPQPNRHISL